MPTVLCVSQCIYIVCVFFLNSSLSTSLSLTLTPRGIPFHTHLSDYLCVTVFVLCVFDFLMFLQWIRFDINWGDFIRQLNTRKQYNKRKKKERKTDW